MVGGQLRLDPQIGQLLAPSPSGLKVFEVAHNRPVVERGVPDLDLVAAIGMRLGELLAHPSEAISETHRKRILADSPRWQSAGEGSRTRPRPSSTATPRATFFRCGR